jgi:hypothetical protein
MYIEPVSPLGTSEQKVTFGDPATIHLITIVQQKIAENPYSFDGETWTPINRDTICQQIGVSQSTLSKILRLPPFIFDVKMEGKVKVTLLRVGVMGKNSPRTCAKIMKKVWIGEIKKFNAQKAILEMHTATLHQQNITHFEGQLKGAVESGNPILVFKATQDLNAEKIHHQKRLAKADKATKDAQAIGKVTPKDFGCFRGLPEHWGLDAAPMVLAYVIRNWSPFMVGVKAKLTAMEADGEEVKYNFFEYPSPAVIRRFADAAGDVM